MKEEQFNKVYEKEIQELSELMMFQFQKEKNRLLTDSELNKIFKCAKESVKKVLKAEIEPNEEEIEKQKI